MDRDEFMKDLSELLSKYKARLVPGQFVLTVRFEGAEGGIVVDRTLRAGTSVPEVVHYV